MERLKFVINISASKENVWNTLWDEPTYRQWTAAFTEGSYAESDWNEGSSILFLSPSGSGMFAVIEKKVLYEQMSFKHLGEVKNGVKEPKEWAGATENYYLSENGGVTELRVEMDASGGEMDEYFKTTFPKALDKVKEIAEG
jgi:Activator of Hsp90 ATPase homolog 1-like protein